MAGRYDLMNDLMSVGVHRAWKEGFVAMCRATRLRVLDIAGGTGDVAFRIAAAGGPRDTGHGLRHQRGDAGRSAASAPARAKDRRLPSRRECGSAALPGGSFDAYTIAFGIRNVPRIEHALAEAYRVLKPGGRFLCLEFARVEMPGLDALYEYS